METQPVPVAMPDADMFLRLAQDEVEYVRQRNMFAAMPADDRKTQGPLKPGMQATMYKAGTPALREKNLWNTMADSFHTSCCALLQPLEEETKKRGITMVTSGLRMQLARILHHASSREPESMEKARLILARLHWNFGLMRQCAHLIMSGKRVAFDGDRTVEYSFEAEVARTPHVAGILYGISQNRYKIPAWSSSERLREVLEYRRTVTSILRLRHSKVPKDYVGCMIARSDVIQDGPDALTNMVTIHDAAGYKVLLPPDYMCPGPDDLLIANFLHRFLPGEGSLSQTELLTWPPVFVHDRPLREAFTADTLHASHLP
jgi:hypothetical protein